MINKYYLIINLLLLVFLSNCEHEIKQLNNQCNCNEISLAFREIRVPVPYDNPYYTLHSERVGFSVDFFTIINKNKIKKGKIILKEKEEFYTICQIPDIEELQDTSFYTISWFSPLDDLEEYSSNINKIEKYRIFYVNNSDTCEIRKHKNFESCINSIENKFYCQTPFWLTTLKRL